MLTNKTKWLDFKYLFHKTLVSTLVLPLSGESVLQRHLRLDIGELVLVEGVFAAIKIIVN